MLRAKAQSPIGHRLCAGTEKHGGAAQGAACNAGIDARLDGRQSLAAIWFRRAIAMGSSDALLQLAKLFFQREDRRVEAISLLHRRIAMGPEQMFEVGGPIDDQRPLPDEDLAEAKRLLNEL